MLKTALSVALIVNLAGYCYSGTYGRPGLSFKAGIGYDFLSQEYFLDGMGQSGVDSLDITTALETTYLENFKGQMALRYNPYQDYRLELEGIYKQTSEEHRVRGYSNFRPTLGHFRLDWNSDLDGARDRRHQRPKVPGVFRAIRDSSWPCRYHPRSVCGPGSRPK